MFRILLIFLVYQFSFTNTFGFSENHQKKLESEFVEFISNQLMNQTFDSSISYLTNVAQLSYRHHYWDLSLSGWIYIAYIADEYREYEIMENALQQCNRLQNERVAEFDSIDPKYIVRADASILQGKYLARQNQFEKAENIYLTLIDHLQQIKDPDKGTIYRVYAFLCDLYMDRGLYEKVYPYYLLMENSIPEDNNHDYYQYQKMLYMGTYFIRKKEFHSARQAVISAFQKIQVKSNKGESASITINFLDLMGIIYQGLNKYDSAMMYFEKSISLQDSKVPSITYTYELYGDCLAGFNRYRESLVYYQKIDSFFRTSESLNSFNKAQILSKIGDAQLKLKNYGQSLKSVQLAFSNIYNDSSFLRNLSGNPVASLIQADKVVIRLLITKSAALYELSRIYPDNMHYLKISIETCLLATRVIDKFRHEISNDDFKQFFVSDIRPMFENAVKACWYAWQKSKKDSLINLAFYFMEKSKNQVLLDAISDDYAQESGILPEIIVKSGNDYRSKLTSSQNLITKLRNEEDSILLGKVMIDFAETQNRYESYLKTIKENYPEYYNLKFNDEVSDIQRLQKTIGNRVFIEYMSGSDFIAIIAADRHNTLFKLIPVDKKFQTTISRLLVNLNKSPYSAETGIEDIYKTFVNCASDLYDLLFKDVRAIFKTKDNFIIVTDGVLSYLPFDVLLERNPVSTDINFAGLDYLLKSAVIQYEFSASILVQNIKGLSLKKNSLNYVGFSPEYSQVSGSQTVKILGNETSVLLMPLKYSNDEVKSAASVFRGNVFAGKKAHVAEFIENIGAARIIHFAGHTFINDSVPELSCLLFSEPEGRLSDHNSESNMIYVNEILSLNLNANLVLLSTCESGYGKLLKGEGLISIGRSFRYAGAQSIVMTLWKINDQSASHIIRLFCKNLKKGRTSDVSLRNAKLDFLANVNPKNTHPYYWAAFVFIGDDGPVMGRGNSWYIIGILLPAIIVLYFLVFKIKIKRRIREIRETSQPDRFGVEIQKHRAL
jgi:CHAT domain-containing protein